MNVADYEEAETPQATARAWEMLAGLTSLQTHIFLRCPGAQGVSMLIDADHDRQVIVLDALRGVPPPRKVGAPMRLEVQIDGRRLEFGCYFQEQVVLPDGPAWLASRPRLLRDMERRVAYRVRIPTRAPLSAMIADADGADLHARILDISHLGFCATIPLALEVETGLVVKSRLMLPDMEVAAEASVRHFAVTPEGTRLGFQFVGLERPLATALQRNVVRLERELLRKYPRPSRARRRA